MTDYYDEQQRIPRRRSATPEDLAARHTSTRSVPASRQSQRMDDEETHTAFPMRPLVRNLTRAPLTPHTREYLIPLSDGTTLRVTERELDDLPEDYQQAARRLAGNLQASGQLYHRLPFTPTISRR